jgi:hypothetical protein
MFEKCFELNFFFSFLWQVKDNDVVAMSLEDPSLGYYSSTIITSYMNLVVMNQLRGH